MGSAFQPPGEGVQFTAHDGVACVPVQREIAGRDAGQRCGGFAASGVADLKKKRSPVHFQSSRSYRGQKASESRRCGC